MNHLVPPSAKYRWLFVPWMAIIVGVFWVMVFLIQEFDFDRGKYRAAVLALVLIATPVLMYVARSAVFSNTRVLSLLLSVGCGGLMCWHFVYFAKVLGDPRIRVIDVASTTLKAADILLEGKNPYTEPVNPLSKMSQGRFSYDGFKYLPMMAMIYAPLGSPWRERGLLTTNLLLDLAVVVLVFLLGAQIGTREGGLFAALLYLMLPIVPYEIFHQGVTDLASVIPLLVALLLLEKRPGLTGLCIGISVSTKLLPGALFLLCSYHPAIGGGTSLGSCWGWRPACFFWFFHLSI